MEHLLTAVRELNDGSPDGRPVLPLVCIDSLNMFGMKPLDRDQIYQLFGLFQKYRIIGVFLVEASQETAFDSTMTDVVISLTSEEDQWYSVKYFEIKKSRYVSEIRGKHPFEIKSLKEQQ